MVKRFAQHLSEGRDAPLYHTVNVRHFAAIMAKNALIASGEFYHSADHLVLSHGDPVNGRLAKSAVTMERGSDHFNPRKPKMKHYYGVSTTRSFKYAKYFGEGMWHHVVFKLDQTKIARTHKILPVDYTSHNPDPFGVVSRREEAEEFIIGQLDNLRSYVIEITFLMPTTSARHIGATAIAADMQHMHDAEQFCKKHNIPYTVIENV